MLKQPWQGDPVCFYAKAKALYLAFRKHLGIIKITYNRTATHFLDDRFVNLGEEVILTLLWQSSASESETVCFVFSSSIYYWLFKCWVLRVMCVCVGGGGSQHSIEFVCVCLCVCVCARRVCLTRPGKGSCRLFDDRPFVADCSTVHKPRPLHVNEWDFSQDKKINFTSKCNFTFKIWFWSFRLVVITLIYVKLLVFVISLILANKLMQ